MKKIVCVIGHFGGNKVFLDGQTVKTKSLTKELKKEIGDNQVDIIDTYGGKKSFIKCIIKSFLALKNSKNIIMLPAHNGVKFLTPLLLFFNIFFHRTLHYSVVGGWLPELTKNNLKLAKKLKKFNYIYVETSTMKKALELQGFNNINVIPNFKDLVPLNASELKYNTIEPYNLCTFSRVNRKKGIEDAVKVITEINKEYGRTIYTLDIYGRIDNGEEEWFNVLSNNFPPYIKYCGEVNFEKSVNIIKNYFALLFPTKYYTEGIPGTIIDAYFSGVPVICSKWESFNDIVENYTTGIGYNFNDLHDLKLILLDVEKTRDMINSYKINCIQKSKQYIPKNVIQRIIKNL